MRYFANPSTPTVREAMRAGLIDCIATPADSHQRTFDLIADGVGWCADNGAFGKGYPGDDVWWAWLQNLVAASSPERCAFAVAPDVVGDAWRTHLRSMPWLARIRSLGIPAAYVAQDGLENLPVPWDEFDVLFIGGTTEWKLGPHAVALTAEAKARGKRVHMGRVNSYQRIDYARHIGCDSADGTYITFGPDQNLPTVLSWLRRLDQQPQLWETA